MIHLTRLNNRPLVVNADLIKFIENAPDTVITLLTGEKLVVRESVEDVLDRVREFHNQSLRRVAPGIPGRDVESFGKTPAMNSVDDEKPDDE